jgi:VanZ family protein
MSLDTRNSSTERPDMALRWGGRLLFMTAFLVITEMALRPGHATPPNLFGSDKIDHIVAFMTLAALSKLGWPTPSILIKSILLLLYGIAIEFMQSTQMVGRTASWSDVVADIIGISLGYFIFNLVKKLIQPS